METETIASIIGSIFGTLITAIATIIVAKIQKQSKKGSNAAPHIDLLPGYYSRPKKQSLRFFIALFAAGAVAGGVFGYLLSVWINSFAPTTTNNIATPTLTVTIYPTKATTQSATGIESNWDNWVVPFEYSSPSGWIWPIGNHTYTISIDCSGNARDVSSTQRFEVAESAELFSDAVYFRVSGINALRLGGNSYDLIERIHPSQHAIAVINLINLSQVEAEYIFGGDCKGAFSIDSQQNQTLIAQQPYRPYEPIWP